MTGKSITGQLSRKKLLKILTTSSWICSNFTQKMKTEKAGLLCQIFTRMSENCVCTMYSFKIASAK